MGKVKKSKKRKDTSSSSCSSGSGASESDSSTSASGASARQAEPSSKLSCPQDSARAQGPPAEARKAPRLGGPMALLGDGGDSPSPASSLGERHSSAVAGK